MMKARRIGCVFLNRERAQFVLRQRIVHHGIVRLLIHERLDRAKCVRHLLLLLLIIVSHTANRIDTLEIRIVAMPRHEACCTY